MSCDSSGGYQRLYQQQQPQRQPSVKIFVTIWQGVALVLAVSILSRGFQPAVETVFSYFGVWISLLMGFVLGALVLVVFAVVSYFVNKVGNESFKEHLAKLSTQDQIALAEIQTTSTTIDSPVSEQRVMYNHEPLSQRVKSPPPVVAPAAAAASPAPGKASVRRDLI